MGNACAEGTGFAANWLGLLVAHGNSPLKIDHLVTFISCQILTWPRTYRKFRKWPGQSYKRQSWSANGFPQPSAGNPPRASVPIPKFVAFCGATFRTSESKGH